MECPKCGHSQNETVECKKCGIIFARYQQHQEKIAAKKAEPAEILSTPVSPDRNPGWLKMAAALALLAGGAFYLLQPPPTPRHSAQNGKTEVSREQQRPASPRPDETVRAATAGPPLHQDFSLEGIAGQLAKKFPANNGLEWARNATVFISTPWGSGSGFFVSGNGQIITNRHVVEFDAAKLKNLQTKADKLKSELDKALRNITYLENQLPGISNPQVHGQVAEEIEQRRREYEKYNGLHKETQEQLDRIARSSWVSDVKVTLIDGTEFPVESLQVSGNNDLALLGIDCYNAPYINASQTLFQINQGQKIYTIGNPAGLRHTVTAGIISGFREYQGKTLIQIDAPINKGNSGGPLVDETGKVLGVNTMTLTDTEGIGFAIPFAEAQKEFALAPPEN
ncbi:trypsin-like peptidase domain-containing protein [Thiovibrio sp. JS02]